MLLKLKFFFLIFFLLPIFIYGQEPVLEDLKNEIENSSKYDREKLRVIHNLKEKISDIHRDSLQYRYELNQKLFEEYKVFKRDSAFIYGLKTKKLAEELGNNVLITEAIISLANINVSSGMYKEALDFLKEINPDVIPENIQSLYYGLLGRCYSEMAEYSKLPYFSDDYNQLAEKYRAIALKLTDEGTFFNSFLNAFTLYKNGKIDRSLVILKNLDRNELSMRDEALVNYMLGQLYTDMDKPNQAIKHYAKSAILDIKTSTKENLAMLRLAELLFQKDDLRNASAFIKKANTDAAFYGAQQRKISIGAVLPLIEEKVVQRIEDQRYRLYLQNIFMALLLIFVIALAIAIYSQVAKLKKAKKIITDAHQSLQETNGRIIIINDKIKLTNEELRVLNDKLLEANKIKEEYIGFFFTQDAEIFQKFQNFKLKIEKNLAEKNYEKVDYLVSNYDFKKEKQKLLENFDEAFIKLFPNFIEEFNSLLKSDQKIKIKKGQLLNKELRIFALIRLGINHNEIIAQILGYSVNSIYAYKTKIRKKSLVDTKNFDEKLLNNTTLKL